jgi:hypothetical protein
MIQLKLNEIYYKYKKISFVIILLLIFIQFIPKDHIYEFANSNLASYLVNNKDLLAQTDTYPYLSNTALFFISKYVYVEHLKTIEPVDRLNNGDLIFVKTNLLNEFFFKIYPKITKRFVLISHHNDDSTNKAHEKYLNDPHSKIIAWYSSNTGFYNRKHLALPLGFQTNYLEGFIYTHRTLHTAMKLALGFKIKDQERVNYVRQLDLNKLTPWHKRKYTMYVNFYVHKRKQNEPDPGSRRRLRDKFKMFPNIYDVKREDFFSYMKHLGESKFVLCPQGFGLDTYRYSEALLMGAIPIVQNSSLYSLFIRSTSLILNDLTDLTQHMLDNPHLYIKNMNFSRNPILIDYWLDEFKSISVLE